MLSNRPTHYNVKGTDSLMSPMFYIDTQNYEFLKELAKLYNTSVSKCFQICIENYRLKEKGEKNSLEKAKKKYLKKRT